MLTIEGVCVDPRIEALAQGQGFTVRLETHWREINWGMRSAVNQAKDEGLIGIYFNGHEDTYAAAKNTLATQMENFKSDITTFINNYNNANQ